MKILKYLLFLILLVIIGSAIYFGTKDGSYDIQDSITIPAPAEVVFDKVNDLKTWESWSSWKQENPDMVFNLAEKSSGQGAILSWTGKRSGALTTTKVIPNKEIIQEMTFESPTGKRKAEMYWIFDAQGDSTKVTWGTKGKLTLMDKAYNSLKGSDLKTSIRKFNREELMKIGEQVKADMKKYTVNVDGVTQYGGGYYMYTTSVAKKQEVGERSASMMTVVQDFIAKNNLHQSGDPFILFNETDTGNNTVIFSTGFPVKERVITPEGSPVVCGFMDPVSALKISLKGNREHLTEAMHKGLEYMNDNGFQPDPSRKVFEVYVTDITKELNPAKWVTEIYIPIQSSEEPAENGI